MKSVSDLRAGSNRVYYEYWMLHHLTDILNQKLLTENDQALANIHFNPNSTGIIQSASVLDKNRNVTNNALLEAFGIHVRALLDFFYGLEIFEKRKKYNRHPDDVFAEDFFDSTKHWRDIRPQIPVDFNTIRRRVNKEIAHITFEGAKVQPESKVWLFEENKRTIDSAYNIFRDQALKEWLGERWAL
jgi:hypothetical protein